MRFKFMGKHLKKQANSIFNKNERLATYIGENLPTSTFDMSFRNATTFNSGKLVPIFCKEAYAGDIFNISVATLLRLSTPQAATMENGIYDINFFFVPFRLVWANFPKLFGESSTAGFNKRFTKTPLINYDAELKYTADDLASYIGFPQNKDFSKIGLPINSLYFKAYCKIVNDYYRDQNVQDEVDFSNNNKNDQNVNVSEFINKPINESLQIGKGLYTTSKQPDYFTTCLPWPQKGDAVTINNLPLKSLFVSNTKTGEELNLFSPIVYRQDGAIMNTTDGQNHVLASNGQSLNDYTLNSATSRNTNPRQANLSLSINAKPDIPLYSLNDLRLAISIQHMLEKDARAGTRWVEYLASHFGVMASDDRVQRAEMIGGFRGDVEINNVVQSSSSVTSSPLGSVAGVSISSGASNGMVNYAVEETGVIMGLITVRSNINYSQGLAKQFTRTEKLDFYDPALANISEQPVRKYEIYLDDTAGETNTNNKVFGYNEAWADLRYYNNQVSGFLSVDNPESLANLYIYTEKYDSAPTLSSAWMEYNESIIGDTLTLDSTKLEFVHQFLADFYFSCKVTRRMPVYSIPGVNKI